VSFHPAPSARISDDRGRRGGQRARTLHGDDVPEPLVRDLVRLDPGDDALLGRVRRGRVDAEVVRPADDQALCEMSVAGTAGWRRRTQFSMPPDPVLR
jgi:hypothetical protein